MNTEHRGNITKSVNRALLARFIDNAATRKLLTVLSVLDCALPIISAASLMGYDIGDNKFKKAMDGISCFVHIQSDEFYRKTISISDEALKNEIINEYQLDMLNILIDLYPGVTKFENDICEGNISLASVWVEYITQLYECLIIIAISIRIPFNEISAHLHVYDLMVQIFAVVQSLEKAESNPYLSYIRLNIYKSLVNLAKAHNSLMMTDEYCQSSIRIDTTYDDCGKYLEQGAQSLTDGTPEKAIEQYTLCLQISEDLYNKYPQNHLIIERHMECQMGACKANERIHQLDKALDYAHKYIDLAEELQTIFENTDCYNIQLGNGYHILGMLYAQKADFANASYYYRESKSFYSYNQNALDNYSACNDIAHDIYKAHSDEPNYVMSISYHYNDLAGEYYTNEDWDQAIVHYTISSSLANQLYINNHNNASIALFTSDNYNMLGSAYEEIYSLMNAYQNYKHAYQIIFDLFIENQLTDITCLDDIDARIDNILQKLNAHDSNLSATFKLSKIKRNIIQDFNYLSADTVIKYALDLWEYADSEMAKVLRINLEQINKDNLNIYLRSQYDNIMKALN